MTIRVVGASRTPYRDRYAAYLDELRKGPVHSVSPTPVRDEYRRRIDALRIPELSDVLARAIYREAQVAGVNPECIGEAVLNGVRYRMPA